MFSYIKQSPCTGVQFLLGCHQPYHWPQTGATLTPGRCFYSGKEEVKKNRMSWGGSSCRFSPTASGRGEARWVLHCLAWAKRVTIDYAVSIYVYLKELPCIDVQFLLIGTNHYPSQPQNSHDLTPGCCFYSGQEEVQKEPKELGETHREESSSQDCCCKLLASH